MKFQPKNRTVQAGFLFQDHRHLCAPATATVVEEDGVSYELPWDLFTRIFEPSDDASREFLQKVQERQQAAEERALYGVPGAPIGQERR